MSLEDSIGSIVTKDVYTIVPDSSVREAASLMVEKDVSCLLVFELENAVGIITERDILRKVTTQELDPKKVRVRDIMSVSLVVAAPNTSIGEAAKKMTDNGIKRLVVVDEEGRFTGLLTMTDLIRWMSKQEKLSDSLIDYLTYGVP